MSSQLLSAFQLGSLALKNRVALAPLTRGRTGTDMHSLRGRAITRLNLLFLGGWGATHFGRLLSPNRFNFSCRL